MTLTDKIVNLLVEVQSTVLQNCGHPQGLTPLSILQLQTVQSHKPQFIALHFQEVGGKDYMVNMSHAEKFFW